MAMKDDEVEVVGSGNTSDSEIADYLAETMKNSSLFIWWSANYEKYPNLGHLAKGYLSAPMSSATSERKFKQAKRAVTGRWIMEPEGGKC